MSLAPNNPFVIALVRDLMFSSRISAEARAAGATIRMVRDPAQLSDPANAAGASQTDQTNTSAAAQLLIIDLNQPGALEAACTWRAAQTRRRVVGFVSHVDTDVIAHARTAGIDQIMPRSQFVRQLPALLSGQAPDAPADS